MIETIKSTIKSPLRYPGGKSRAVKHILPLFPPEVKMVASPFFGGGSIELALAQKGVFVMGYDAFKPLVAFWRFLQICPRVLAMNIMQHYPLSKQDFYRLQRSHIDEQTYEQAVSFFVLNRASFDGTTMSGGCSNPSNRFTESSIKRVRDWQHIDNLWVDSRDFRDSLYYNEEKFWFLDPPYLIDSNLYGERGNLHKNFSHLALYDLVKNHSGFLITYNDCPEIRELYSKYRIRNAEWAYGMGKSKKSREIIISDF